MTTLLLDLRQLNSKQTANLGLAELISLLRLWIGRHHQRKQLARLSDELLDDLGISRAEAMEEANKPFWR